MIRGCVLSLVLLANMTGLTLADEPKAKEHKLAVAFGTPNPNWKATISEARVVGKEIWVRVDVASADGIALAVIGKAKDEATIQAPDLPVKYLVFGKKWGWKNEEKGFTFLADLDKAAAEKLEKEYAAGKVVFEKKK
jgi:hypothetical protein